MVKFKPILRPIGLKIRKSTFVTNIFKLNIEYARNISCNSIVNLKYCISSSTSFLRGLHIILIFHFHVSGVSSVNVSYLCVSKIYFATISHVFCLLQSKNTFIKFPVNVLFLLPPQGRRHIFQSGGGAE